MHNIHQILPLPTSNYSVGRGRHKPLLIVSHLADGSYEGTISWFQNPSSKVSSDFLIATNGRITQFGRLQDTKYCNYTQATNPRATAYVSDSTSLLVRQLGGNANQYSISIEHEGFYRQTKGKLSPQQHASNIWLSKYIQSEVERIWGHRIPMDREHLIGHNEINPKGRPNCPGADFPWPAIRQEVAPEEMEEKRYHVRDYANNPSSQLAAFRSKENAIAMATNHRGYAVFDQKGTLIYLPEKVEVGNRVRTIGSHWATGQEIPRWVKNGQHTVIQLSGRNALLGGIRSWIRLEDVQRI